MGNKSNLSQLNQPSYIYAILGVSLVLFLLGFFSLTMLQARQLIRIFKEKVNVIVELKRDADQQDMIHFEEAIENEIYVKESSVKFISKDDAIELLREDFGEEFLTMDFNNPLYDVISFNVAANHMDTEQLVEIKEALKKNPIVRDVYYQEGLVDNISKNIEKVGLFALLISILFIFVALTLIHNTIKLALYANRFLIKNMELVGATWAFISRPFLVRSLINGLISAGIAIFGILVLTFLARLQLPELAHIQSVGTFIAVFILLLLVGAFITVASTYFVVHKYLKTNIKDLY